MIDITTKEGTLIKSGPEIEVTTAIRSVDDLFASEVIGEFIPGAGQFVILPKGTQILNKVYALLNQYITEALNFDEVVLPKIAPVETFRKADILGKWDDYLLSAKPFSKTKGVEEEFILDPLQCTTFYEFHKNKKIDVSQEARKWFDRSGPTYRNEDLDKLEPSVKQREYHRAEFIYLGTPKQVVEAREKCLTQIEKLCQDLELKYRIVVGGGCYQLKEGEIPKAGSIDKIPIKDLEIYVPHQDRWLEVVGSSVLANTLTSRFNIQGNNGEELWSGCTGIGLNRMMYAIISYHGCDVDVLSKVN
jgi:seryl-tRNA synthetase